MIFLGGGDDTEGDPVRVKKKRCFISGFEWV